MRQSSNSSFVNVSFTINQPYFLRLEDFEPGASELHNVGGSSSLAQKHSAVELERL